MTNIKSDVSNISIHNAYEPPVVNKETEKNQTLEMKKHASITDAPAPNVINNISINGPRRFKLFGFGGKCYSISIPFTNKTRTHNVLLPTDPKVHTSHDVTAEHIDVNLGASLHPSYNNQKLKIGIIGCGGTIAGKAVSNTESASSACHAIGRSQPHEFESNYDRIASSKRLRDINTIDQPIKKARLGYSIKEVQINLWGHPNRGNYSRTRNFDDIFMVKDIVAAIALSILYKLRVVNELIYEKRSKSINGIDLDLDEKIDCELVRPGENTPVQTEVAKILSYK